ncbi:MAG: hypothetical protein JNJ54_11870 [Myxococcaceae bacterium]|nr:hypothetical protein [Myxococcaceae bacterium]
MTPRSLRCGVLWLSVLAGCAGAGPGVDGGAGGGATGGGTAGGSTAGGSTAGGSTAGGSTAGGSTAGGSTAGGSTAGGSTAGGSTAGGSTAGGSTAGGSTAGGSTAGGSTAGGSTAGGSTAGGSTAGGAGGGTSARLLFFDGVSYSLGRLDSAAAKRATALDAGYTGIKDEQTNPGGAAGYLYTVSTIEGDTSGIPGGGRALVLETRANTQQAQPDYYVQLGDGMPGAFPPNLWIQLWMYVQDDAASSKRSVIVGRNKFIYPLLGSRPGYPSATEDTAWLLGFRPTAADLTQGRSVAQPSPAALVFENRGLSAGAAGARASHPHLQGSGLEDYLYPNVNVPTDGDRFLLPNRWYLVRFHIDTSGAPNSNTSVYEVWWREKGAQAGGLVKKCEFLGGQPAPASPSFSFYNRLLDNQGAKMLRIPTTVGSTSAPWGDSWIYLKDLAIASDAAQLPTYSSY